MIWFCFRNPAFKRAGFFIKFFNQINIKNIMQPIALKRIRPGNVRVNNHTLNMNERREIINPKNTLQPFHSLGVKVARYFTDVDGRILAKNDAGLVAAGMAVNYPIFLLGQWDKESGYKAGLNIVPPAVPYYLTFVNGYGMTSNQILTPFSGVNAIQGYLKNGDIVSVYADNLLSPNYFAWIVVSSNVSGIASILNNSGTRQKDNRLMRLFCSEINLVCNFQLQLGESWHYVNVDNLGNVKDNQITYNQFNDPFNVLPDVLTIPTEFEFNQYLGIYFYMVLAVDTMSLNFNFKIVE